MKSSQILVTFNKTVVDFIMYINEGVINKTIEIIENIRLRSAMLPRFRSPAAREIALPCCVKDSFLSEDEIFKWMEEGDPRQIE